MRVLSGITSVQNKFLRKKTGIGDTPGRGNFPGYVRISSWKAFSSGPTYTWTGLTWNYANYPCLVMVWHYVDTSGQGGCGFSTSDQYDPYCPGSPVSSWQTSDFFPC